MARPTEMLTIKAPGLSAKAHAFAVLMPQQIDKGMEAGVRAASIMLAGEIQDLLDGEVLNKQTGKLWRSFSNPKVYKRAGRWFGIVGTNVVYGAIHEFGGTIIPRNAEFLRFKVGGNWVQTKKVTIPARPYVGRAFRENADRVPDIIENHIERRIERVLGGVF